jgi:hypothetical protein
VGSADVAPLAHWLASLPGIDTANTSFDLPGLADDHAPPAFEIPIPGDNPRLDRSESLTLRLLRDMRTEPSAAMQAMQTEAANVRRLDAQMERMFDRLDEIKAELTAFRAEIGKGLRRLESDMIAAEGQNIARQAEIIDVISRVGELEIG